MRQCDQGAAAVTQAAGQAAFFVTVATAVPAFCLPC